jgi:hypothetical protein
MAAAMMSPNNQNLSPTSNATSSLQLHSPKSASLILQSFSRWINAICQYLELEETAQTDENQEELLNLFHEIHADAGKLLLTVFNTSSVIPSVELNNLNSSDIISKFFIVNLSTLNSVNNQLLLTQSNQSEHAAILRYQIQLIELAVLTLKLNEFHHFQLISIDDFNGIQQEFQLIPSVLQAIRLQIKLCHNFESRTSSSAEKSEEVAAVSFSSGPNNDKKTRRRFSSLAATSPRKSMETDAKSFDFDSFFGLSTIQSNSTATSSSLNLAVIVDYLFLLEISLNCASTPLKLALLQNAEDIFKLFDQTQLHHANINNLTNHQRHLIRQLIIQIFHKMLHSAKAVSSVVPISVSNSEPAAPIEFEFLEEFHRKSYMQALINNLTQINSAVLAQESENYDENEIIHSISDNFQLISILLYSSFRLVSVAKAISAANPAFSPIEVQKLQENDEIEKNSSSSSVHSLLSICTLLFNDFQVNHGYDIISAIPLNNSAFCNFSIREEASFAAVNRSFQNYFNCLQLLSLISPLSNETGDSTVPKEAETDELTTKVSSKAPNDKMAVPRYVQRTAWIIFSCFLHSGN